MVYLKTDSWEGKSDVFGKDKMLQNILQPKLTKIATQAGLDPAGFKPDEATMERFYQTPFLNVMPDGSTYTPVYDYKEKSRSNLVWNVTESLDLQGFAGFWRRANLRVFVSWGNRAKDVWIGRCVRKSE